MPIAQVSSSSLFRRNPLIAAAALLAFATTAAAQVGSNYAFTQNAGTYSPITGGTVISTATTANTLDDNTFAVPLPFPFTFDGVTHTAISVQTNGWLSFGSTLAATSYTPLSQTAVLPGVVAACGRDLQGGYVFGCTRTLGSDQLTNVNVSSNGPLQVGDVLTGTGIAAGTTILAITGNVITMSANATATSAVAAAVTAYGPWSDMRWELQGTSPNQVFVVQWSNFRRFGTTLTTTQDTNLNFQIRLNENNNEVEVVYGNCAPGATTTTALHQVGLRGPTNAFPANVNGRQNTKGTDDWATSAPALANTSGELFNNVAPANVIPSGLTYKWVQNPGVLATNTSYGAGCGASYASAYQLFTTSASASATLSNTSLALTNLGTGYAFTAGSASYVTPSGTATNLALGDDAEASIVLSAAMPYPGGNASTLFVCSNGFVSAATGNGTGFTPSGAAFCNMAQAVWGCWHDWNPAEVGSGLVKFEEVGGIAYITWENVESYPGVPTVNPGTMQLQFDVATGNVNIVFGLLDAVGGSTFGDNYLVGYSPAGANLDPGSSNFATAMPFVTPAADVAALALSASPTPVLGSTVIYTTSNIPATALVSADIISLIQVNPGIDLGFMGAPGCLQLVDLSLASTSLIFGAPTATLSFAVPNNPGLVGLPLNVQSASFVPSANALGVITSNAIRSVLGNF